MLVALTLAALQVAAAQPRELALARPPSLNTEVLAACAPRSLEAAEACLVQALSPADLAIVQDRIPARRFRPGLDCEIEKSWRLADPKSPMAKVMRKKLGRHDASMAAGMIISDLQSRASGEGLKFKDLKKAIQQFPRGGSASTCDVTILDPAVPGSANAN